MAALYVCETCASPDVEVQEWRKANTGECSGEGTADPYCPACEDECIIKVVDVENFADGYDFYIRASEGFHLASAKEGE